MHMTWKYQKSWEKEKKIQDFLGFKSSKFLIDI